MTITVATSDARYPGSIEAECKSSGYPEIFGTREVCYSTGGPANHSEQSIYLASVKDAANYTVTSQLYYRSRVMAFGQGFLPIIEHYDGDTLPVPPPPSCRR